MNDETADTASDSRHPVLVDERFSQKLWSPGATRGIQRVQLRYKPYFKFEETLRKKILRGDNDVYDSVIVVDGLTGVARLILKEQIETAVERVDETDVLDPEIDVGTAQNRVNRNRIKVSATKPLRRSISRC